MKVIAAYLLAVLGGNNSPNAQDIERILASVGIVAEPQRVQLLLSQMEGKSHTQSHNETTESYITVPLCPQCEKAATRGAKMLELMRANNQQAGAMLNPPQESAQSLLTEEDIPRIKEALVEIIAEYLYIQLGHRDDAQTHKTSLYDIQYCTKSGCPDFNYAYKMPLGDFMCVCGSRYCSHVFAAW